ncbi:unnamed protein product [Phytophthora lilii]|uniref:Unnamed protein product n=1 Tax=Phytophthora lilii TaxID=2077276 RepID=A0A9W6UD94_9STRA|nr:unnamed protein product [Phytophthora lilii]
MPLSPKTKRQLEAKLRPLLTRLRDEDQESGTRPILALQLKEKVAECLRGWIAEPVEGFVLRKEHVVNGMRLDDLVATPAGAGYLRGYRHEDGFCTVVYPWGHGFVHVKDVEKVQQALDKHLKKRTYNEYVALEHQQLYEQIEGLLENLPPPMPEESGATKKDTSAAEQEEGVGFEEYKELLKSLEEEVRLPWSSFLRRIQALAKKVKELRRSQAPIEPEQKLMRMDDDDEIPTEEGQQQESEKSMQMHEAVVHEEEKQELSDGGQQISEKKDDNEKQ